MATPRADPAASDPEVDGFLALLAAQTGAEDRRRLSPRPARARRLAGRAAVEGDDRRPRALARRAPRRGPLPRDDRAPRGRRALLLPPPDPARRPHRQPRRRARAAASPPAPAPHALGRGGPAPDRGSPGTTPRSLRDRALVELLYGAGLRVSEAVGLGKTDVDLERRLVRCTGKGNKERVVPVGRHAIEALRRYLAHGRPYLDRRHRPELFLNAQGGALTRAGAFLILRRLAERAGLEPGARAPAPPAALVRDTSARGRRRPAQRPGDARPRRPRDDRALHPRQRPPAPRRLLPEPPTRPAPGRFG